MKDDFFSTYLRYTGEAESPVFFNRWAAISGIGALLGRQFYFNHGHFSINTNMYTMLIGSPGTRKSTAIKMMKHLLQASGYDTIAADKTSKEKFLLDLSGEPEQEFDSRGRPIPKKVTEDILNKNLWGDDSETATGKEDCEMYIMADEFNDFIGTGNIEFISLLGTLWDFTGTYKSRIKSGKSVAVPNPTVSILGGNTPTGFSISFPPEVIGQGFFSRLLLIYGEPSGRKVTFPVPPKPEDTAELLTSMAEIKKQVSGPAIMMPAARKLIDKIYHSYRGIDDSRFESYTNRRLNHLLKLCLIVSASYGRVEVSESDIVYANTILTHTESLMPKALGEFGKAKNSAAAQKIMQSLECTDRILTMAELWRSVSNDLDAMKDLGNILQSLAVAGKIQSVQGGFLPIKKVAIQENSDCLDYSILTDEERGIAI